MLLPRCLWRSFRRSIVAVAALSAQIIIQEAMAEERSVLQGATGPSNLDPKENTSSNALIDGGFMSMAVSTWKNPDNMNEK